MPEELCVPVGDVVEPEADALLEAGIGESDGVDVEFTDDVAGKGDVSAGVLSNNTDGNTLDCGADVTPDAPGFSDVAPISPGFALAA